MNSHWDSKKNPQKQNKTKPTVFFKLFEESQKKL